MTNRTSSENQQGSLAEALEPLTEEILAYVKDSKHSYAIGLEGDWGSGKTRYLEGIVRPKLKEAGRSMIRVSLFGVESSDELYRGIGVSLFRLDDKKSKSKEAAKTLARQVPGLIKSIKSAFGVNVSINVNMKDFVGLFLRKEKHVLVFDDLERRRSNDGDKESKEIFGAINDLVENKGYKAIVVSNAIMEDGQSSEKALNSNIREKLVWRVLKFQPDPAALANDVIGSISNDHADFDVMEAVRGAAVSAQCRNARSMLKADALINRLCRASFVSDAGLAQSGRKAALRDAIQLSLMICMEREPKKPADHKPGSHGDLDFLEHITQQRLYEQYRDLTFLSPCLKSMNPINDDEIDGRMREYIALRYPDSPDTAELSSIVERINYIHSMRDEDVESIIPGFSAAVRRRDFSPGILRDVVRTNDQLRKVGFTGLLDDNEIVECGKEVLAKDPEKGYIAFGERALTLDPPSGSCRGVLDELRDYASEAYENHITTILMSSLDFSDETCGSVLSESLRRIWQRRSDLVLGINSDIVVEAFRSSSPAAQDDLRGFFIGLKGIVPFRGEGTEPYVEWLEGILSVLEAREMKSKLDTMRKGWFISNLNDLLEPLRPRD